MQSKSSKPERILDVYRSLAEMKMGEQPTHHDMLANGITRDMIRYHYGNITQLRAVAENANAAPIMEVLPEPVEVSEPDGTKARILEAYKRLMKDNWSIPAYSDMAVLGYSRDMIRHHFGNITSLHAEATSNADPDVVFIRDLKQDKKDIIKKRLIVTTAVANSKMHPDFIRSMETYCAARDAQIVVMLCEAKTNSFQNESAIFDPLLVSNPNIAIIKEDTPLNANLFLCTIQVSANQIRPITGLSRIGAREGSYIFAAPKQFLEYVPTASSGKNYTIMTTGACTIPNYFDVKTFVSKRLAYIADHDHTMGAIIVEIVDDNTFHFRQIQMAGDGSFIDLGVQYLPDGTIEHGVSTTVVLGDLHGTSVDVDNLNAFISNFDTLNIDRVVLHDAFDGQSISHHIREPGEKASRGSASLVEELRSTFETAVHIRQTLDPVNGLVFVKSNHDEVIDRWIKEGRYLYEAENYRIGHHLALVKYDKGEDLLKAAFRYAFDDFGTGVYFDQVIQDWNFHPRDEPLKFAGVELGAHGDLGANGSRASLAQIEKIYGNCVVGHAHSAAIQRNVFRVGTFSLLRMSYNRGPSSWTQTACLVYPDGSKQLVNNIGGEFYRDAL